MFGQFFTRKSIKQDGKQMNIDGVLTSSLWHSIWRYLK